MAFLDRAANPLYGVLNHSDRHKRPPFDRKLLHHSDTIRLQSPLPETPKDLTLDDGAVGPSF